MKLGLLELFIILCGIAFVGLIIQQTAKISPAVAIAEVAAALIGYYIYRKIK